ncbi:AbrB/MazE/SpoVT family DNA-binding domain-containing protein [Spirosoma sp. KCTC 42546]|uniref:AbrB/MazE/SpoVT family DNA-binding domain-containing protein n=1 Tax=Spirosoma sp. KCTC 42546 TaxID=2520506 RepID=UPI001159C710|nr:AbrB/MazE/SpoVT family DNA-binding domain-containing protein [Spirosoma sp. KCTC 42546]QDK82447.1 AbrB/MazE/SpoVT family DNA-binding domain-containing protein [Spirosoma sp. KCTC 42546]
MQVHIRRIGNSQGIILPRPLLQQAGIENEVDLEVIDGAIVLRPAKSDPRANWDQLFQNAIEAGHKPEKDLFNGASNDFDQTEWQW